MGARLVLLAFMVLYALVGVALSPAHGRIAPVDDWVSSGLTLAAFALVLALDYPAMWLADRLGIAGQTAVVGIVAVLCLLLAVFAIVRLARRDVGGKAAATFLLMLALSVPAGVVLTLYRSSTFGH
jgi:hypothetical protein